nr:hypothetical protein [uncultured Oscillibacter sp.]
MVKSVTKRIERIKAALDAQDRQKINQPTLVYADGSRRTMGVVEAVGEIGRRQDIVDVLSGDETTSSLLRGILGPWDFSDLEELNDLLNERK